MHPPIAWELTIALIVGLLLFDYFFHVRTAHVPKLGEAGTWSAIYVSVAVLFGAAVWILGGSEMGIQYFAGYPSNTVSLSVINGWNSDHRFGRAYLSDKGSSRVEMDVDLDDGGMSYGLFEDNLQFWVATMAAFEKHIGRTGK